MTVDELWSELVTTSLLGTDRRDPPALDGLIDELVADSARPEPSARMLTAVAGCVAVRRAGVQPAAPADPLSPPSVDDRPECVPAASDRWHHITTSWPVLEDEWMITLISQGWRLAPELVPAALQRHRRDPARRSRAVVAAGPLAAWLVAHVPELAPSASVESRSADAGEHLGELPELPIPQELAMLLERPGAELGGIIAVGVEDGSFAHAHRGVLVNVIARCMPAGLADVAEVLGAVDPRSPGHALATVLADLATTRRRMLDELSRPDAAHAASASVTVR